MYRDLVWGITYRRVSAPQVVRRHFGSETLLAFSIICALTLCALRHVEGDRRNGSQTVPSPFSALLCPAGKFAKGTARCSDRLHHHRVRTQGFDDPQLFSGFAVCIGRLVHAVFDLYWRAPRRDGRDLCSLLLHRTQPMRDLTRGRSRIEMKPG